MGKSKVGSRPNEFKYGMALYGVAWPRGDYYFVSGGGGHGLVPRIVWAKYKNGKCSDQLGEYKTGQDTAMRMAICPWGASLLIASANGGIRRLQIGSCDHGSDLPAKLIDVSAAFLESIRELNAEIGTMAFNSRGDLLAIGFKERTELHPGDQQPRALPALVKVVRYPSMKAALEFTLNGPEVKDIDFCHIHPPQQQQFELLATVGDHGLCEVWLLQDTSAQNIAQLPLPKALQGVDAGKIKFNKCRFNRPAGNLTNEQGNSNHQHHTEDIRLYTQINHRKSRDVSLCYLAVYGPPPAGAGAGAPWQCLKHCVAHNNSQGSCMDISKYGECIVFGFSEGDLRVYDAQSLQLLKQDEASIAFVTSVVFNADNTAVIAVGGDANCFVMELAPKSKRGWGPLLFLFLLMVAAVALLHFWQHPEQLPYQLLQQLQQWSKQPDHPLTQACSNGSAWERIPLRQPVCGWVQKAAQLLPEDVHDEL